MQAGDALAVFLSMSQNLRGSVIKMKVIHEMFRRYIGNDREEAKLTKSEREITNLIHRLEFDKVSRAPENLKDILQKQEKAWNAKI